MLYNTIVILFDTNYNNVIEAGAKAAGTFYFTNLFISHLFNLVLDFFKNFS